MTEMNPQTDQNPSPRRWGGAEMSGLLGGLLILIVGLVFLLDNLNVIASVNIFRFWPLILVALGLKHLFEARDRGAAVGAVLLTSVGVLFQLDRLHIIEVRFWQLWPLLLVAFGFQMLMRSLSGPPRPPAAATDAETATSFSSSAFLGGIKRRNCSKAFRGGSVSVIMGGVELDLTKAEIEGNTATIQISAMMGGVELRIPETWSVETRIVPLLGGVEDKTIPPRDSSKVLVLLGSIVMGGVEIKN